MGSYHAVLSPSSASRWTTCTASVDAQEGITDDGSAAARLGTTGHQLSAECLETKADPQSYLGRVMCFHVNDAGKYMGEDWKGSSSAVAAWPVAHEVVVDQEQIDACCSYINLINDIVEKTGATLYVEQRVPVGHITGEEGASGTSDTILLTETTLSAYDLKLGRKKVDAFDVITPAGIDIITGEPTPQVLRLNLQIALYLLGSLEKYGYHGDFTHVTGCIVQPHLHHVSEYTCTVEELLALGEWLKARANETRTNPVFAPSYDNCCFCKARFTCKARETVVLETALEGFDDVDHAKPREITANKLGSLYARVEMIKSWCADVETRVYEELLAGHPVMRNDGVQYKLVTGKKGARAWIDADAAEAALKRMRLKQDEMYTRTVISPATVEKLAVAKKPKKGQPAPPPPLLSEKQWAKLQELIHQKDGSPTVALETDPRPAIACALDEFGDAAPAVSDCSDLF